MCPRRHATEEGAGFGLCYVLNAVILRCARVILLSSSVREGGVRS